MGFNMGALGAAAGAAAEQINVNDQVALQRRAADLADKNFGLAQNADTRQAAEALRQQGAYEQGLKSRADAVQAGDQFLNATSDKYAGVKHVYDSNFGQYGVGEHADYNVNIAPLDDGGAAAYFTHKTKTNPDGSPLAQGTVHRFSPEEVAQRAQGAAEIYRAQLMRAYPEKAVEIQHLTSTEILKRAEIAARSRDTAAEIAGRSADTKEHVRGTLGAAAIGAKSAADVERMRAASGEKIAAGTLSGVMARVEYDRQQATKKLDDERYSAAVKKVVDGTYTLPDGKPDLVKGTELSNFMSKHPKGNEYLTSAPSATRDAMLAEIKQDFEQAKIANAQGEGRMWGGRTGNSAAIGTTRPVSFADDVIDPTGAGLGTYLYRNPVVPFTDNRVTQVGGAQGQFVPTVNLAAINGGTNDSKVVGTLARAQAEREASESGMNERVAAARAANKAQSAVVTEANNNVLKKATKQMVDGRINQ